MRLRPITVILIIVLLGFSFSGSGCGSTKSSSNPPSNNVAPSITTQPASQTVTVGQTATFSVVASGSALLSYQWQKNGANISNAMSSSYTTPPTASSDSGSMFLVVVSNAAGNVTSAAATLTVNSPTSPTITTQPSNQTVAVGQTATFSVIATGATPLSYQWQKNSANISGAMSSTYTTAPTMSSDNGTTFQVVVRNSLGSVTSNAATLTVTAMSSGVDVVTYHNDNGRTGQNLDETTLTPSNVNSNNFGLLKLLPVDGKVDAEPLYLSNLTVAGSAHNVVFVVTEHDTVYAFDADSYSELWHMSMLLPNESPSDDRGCGQVSPEIGITATPVIDRSAGAHGTIYVAAMSKDGSGNYFQRLHALDITTGADLPGSPQVIQATFPGTGANSSSGQVIFDAKLYKERPGLLLLNGVLYTSWSSHCDNGLYTGWIIAYNPATLQRVYVLNITPNGSEGSIWAAGAGPAADAAGNIYFLAANGTFDTTLDGNGFPSQGDFGNAFVKLSINNSNHLIVSDYFTMHNTVVESNGDQDLGSGGALVLPDLKDGSGNVKHLAVGAGKDGNIYIVNRDSMGKFNPANDNAIYQELVSGLGGSEFAMPVYFNGVVYYGAVGDFIRAFPISNAKLAVSPSSMTNNSFAYPGTTPSISGNGAANGIVWAVENGSTGVLHAYNATDLTRELYNSDQAGTRDQFSDNKFITPMIANGKVFVGTTSSAAVFGLLH
ncbi:MAG: immunoglobulin domain-containing protein [Candidatus Acidiferrales bacterium]